MQRVKYFSEYIFGFVKMVKLTKAEKDFIIKEAKAIGTDEKHLRFRDYQATGYKEGFVWILMSKWKIAYGVNREGIHKFFPWA